MVKGDIVSLEYAMENNLRKAISTLLILQVLSQKSMCVPETFDYINCLLGNHFWRKYSLQYKVINRLVEKGYVVKKRGRADNYQLLDFCFLSDTGAMKLRYLRQQFVSFTNIIFSILNNSLIVENVLYEKDPVFIESLKKVVCPLLILLALSKNDMCLSEIAYSNYLFEIISPDEAVGRLESIRCIATYKNKNLLNRKKTHYKITDKGRFELHRLIKKFQTLTKQVLIILDERSALYE